MKDERPYLFVCDKCNKYFWVNKATSNDHLKLCNECWVKMPPWEKKYWLKGEGNNSI